MISIMIVIIGIFLLFYFGKGTTLYKSKLTNLDIKIPKYIFSLKEYKEDETYSIFFKSIRRKEKIQEEMRNMYSLEEENYIIVDWGYDDKNFLIKEYFVVYEKVE